MITWINFHLHDTEFKWELFRSSFRWAVGSEWSLNTKSDWPVTQVKELFDGIVSQDQLASLVCMKWNGVRFAALW
jgi:hypothetical protein